MKLLRNGSPARRPSSLRLLIIAITFTALPSLWIARLSAERLHPFGLIRYLRNSASASSGEIDADGDKLSDYQEVHKYFTDPQKRDAAGKGTPDGEWRRREFTYTITSIMRILKPVRLSDMNDDYQDARLLSEDKDSATVEVTYYPLNTNKEAIEADPNWKEDDAGMTEYLKPTPTENWDEPMRQALVARLKADGIDPDALTDKQLVQQVADWALRRSRFTPAFACWFVDFSSGKPTVPAELRTAFDAEKPNKSWTDQQMFDQELLGKSMFYNSIHGSCTSSAVYLTTLLRALGIPTRIIFCVPAADPNNERQINTLLANIHHHQVKAVVEQGLTELHNGWHNHLFNEVYIGRHWVRLNYNTLGQNILDPNYFGLLTHIYTCRSLSEVPLARTWGRRYARYDEDKRIAPRLSSVNPYMLLSASDHFGTYSHIANPVLPIQELRTATISDLYWKNSAALPQVARAMAGPTDFLIGINEWIEGQDYRQLRRFFRRAGHHFVLQAPGRPDVAVTLNGSNYVERNDMLPGGPVKVQGYVAHIAPEEWRKMAPGVRYRLIPNNTSPTYRWVAPPILCLIR